MGRIASKLKREFQRALGNKVVSLTGILEGQRMAEADETVDQLIQKGYDPVHAIYIETINLASRFAEGATALPPLHCAFDFLEKAQNTYCPGYPPMSPLTVSYYVAWTLFDVRFGHDRETIGDCLAELADLLELNPIQVEALGNLRRSRMGIYKVLRGHGRRFNLRELLTGHEFDALIPTGFRSGTDSVVLARLLPPLHGLASYHIAITTPYVLVGQTDSDWIHYFPAIRYSRVPSAPMIDCVNTSSTGLMTSIGVNTSFTAT